MRAFRPALPDPDNRRGTLEDLRGGA
jgi:hypothetical protein